MAVSKVVYDGETLIDLTEDSVTPTSMLSGATAHDASGEQIEGKLMTLNGTTEKTPNSVAILVPYSDFGDATAEDVLAGKTFTSSAGLKVVGTGEIGGVTSVEPELYGSYTLAEIIEARSLVAPFELELAGSGVMAYFWDGAEHRYAEVSKIAFTGGFNVEIRSSEYGTITYTTEEGWKVGGATPTDQQHRVITFTIPTKVPPAFYQNWFAITKNSAETSFEIGEDVGYDKGYAEGEANGGTAKPVLYGTYLLKESIDYSGVSETIAHVFTEAYDEDYAYCYPAQTYDLNERSPILHIEFEPDKIMVIPNHENLHLRYQIATGYWEVVQEVDYDEYTQPFPAERCRILEFNKPYEVSQEFYDLFVSIVDNTDGTAYEIGHTEGVKTQYDEFWDSYQANGTATNYSYAFAGTGWNDETFKPKYDIVPVAAEHIFSNTGITDIIGCLEKAGVSIDFSKLTSTTYIMQNSKKATNFPIVDFRKRSHCNYSFYNNDLLHTIEKVILKDDGSQGFTNYSFGYNPELVEIRFEGVIGKNGLNLQWSTKLSKESITSIINALSTTTSGLSITLSMAAINAAFESSEGANDGITQTEFLDLQYARQNWTINLV